MAKNNIKKRKIHFKMIAQLFQISVSAHGNADLVFWGYALAIASFIRFVFN